jgi:uncharacterized protein (DUF1501 family)
MRFDRRQFLKSLAVGTGIATSGTLGWLDHLRADETTVTTKRFVFFEFGGAWDTLLSLDPRDPTEFTEANVSTTGIQLAHQLLDTMYSANPLKTVANITFGPAVPQSFADLAPKMCVGRGLTMNTLSHDVGRVFWSTGRTPAGANPTAPSVACQIIDQIAAAAPAELGLIPNLSINADVFSTATDPALRPFQIRNANDMMLALKLGTEPLSELILTELADELAAYREASSLCDPAKLDRYGKMSLVRKSQEEVKAIVESGLSDKFNLTNVSDPEMLALAVHYGYTAVEQPAALAAVAAQALKLDMSRCVTVRFGNSFDDHDGTWSTDQPADQEAAFDAIAKLYEDLAQTPSPSDPNKMLADETVIVMGSDFSRTPILNSTEGRDHWPVNSCAFIGGMPAGRVIGASTHYGMESSAIDPMTGDPVPAETQGAVTMNPGHWMASLLTNEGLSIADLREEPLPCLSTS